jgi:hypothetical protein
MEANASSPPATDPRMALPSQAISLGSHDTSPLTGVQRPDEDDSDLDCFIAGDDEDIEMESNDPFDDGDDDTLPPSSLLFRSTARTANHVLTQNETNRLDDDDDDDDDELPDIEDFIQGRRKPNSPRVEGPAPKKRRMILDSDDD